MKESLLFLLLFAYSFSIEPQSFTDIDIDISKFKIASSTDQIILVIPPNYTSTSAMLYFYVKKENKWNQTKETNAFIGYNGLGKEKEGDGKTPVGVYKFNCYFGIEDNPGTKLPYIQVNNSHYWDSDPESKRYNTLVNNETYKDFDISKSEHIIDVKPGYEYAINIDYNKDRTKYKGSGIFLHCFTKNPFTAGCVSINITELKDIYGKINENCHIIIDTKENMTKYYSASNFIKSGIFMFMCFILLF